MREGHTDRSFFPICISFCVAASTLLSQLVQTRIFSVVFWNHLVYFIISIALLGFGISGTWLSFGKKSRVARWLTLPNAAIGFTISLLISSFLMPRLGISMGEAYQSQIRLLQLMLTYAVAVLPYFFGGWILGVTFRDNASRMHSLYFADLLGASLGCIAFLVGMQPLGPLILTLVCCALVLVPIIGMEIRKGRGWVTFVVGTVLLLGCFVLRTEIEAGVVPERQKAYSKHLREFSETGNPTVELSEWNSLSRIDIVSYSNPKRKFIYIDGDAWTGIQSTPETFKPWVPNRDRFVSHLAPFLIQPEIESALVIGFGGGVDVQAALRAGAKRLDAVEINPTTARAGTDIFREYNNDLFHRDGVKVWVEEGRSFVSRSDSQYDLIMIHGIDTFAALSSGAYVLSESYLYTVEAMKAYLNHLSPGGTLCIVRWDYRGETARLFTVALEALYELGVENPEQNIFYGTQAHTCLLVRKDGFSDGEIDVLQDYLLAGQGSTLFPPLDPESAGGTEKIIAEYTVARSQDKHQAFLDAYRYDISPVRDDSPFFFHYEKTAFWRKVGGDRSSNFIRGNWSSYTLHMLFGFSCVAVVLFMVLPLLHRGRPNIPHFPIWLLYFACLGVSFIFVEIALMQRFALLLGHPARSLALVLTSLLFFAGVGSQLKHTLNLKLSTSLAMIVVMLLVVAWGYPPLVNLLLGFSYPVRVLATILMVAPTAFFMGMPFPAGITRVAESGEDAVPWMWGINGGTTVVGSILAILVAIEINFTIVLLLAALGYAIALLMNWKVLRIS